MLNLTGIISVLHHLVKCRWPSETEVNKLCLHLVVFPV